MVDSKPPLKPPGLLASSSAALSEAAFAAPMRSVVRFSNRHSRIVQAFKVILPLIAIGLVGLMAAWPKLAVNAPTANNNQDTGQLLMKKAHYFGIDKSDRPYSIIADSARELTSERGVIDMINPNAEMTLSNGAWMYIEADHGVYNENTKKLLLNGHVHLIHDGGFEFTTEEAHVNAADSTAWGNHRIIGQGPFGEVDAQGFQILAKGQNVMFLGDSSLHLASGKSPS